MARRLIREEGILCGKKKCRLLILSAPYNKFGAQVVVAEQLFQQR